MMTAIVLGVALFALACAPIAWSTWRDWRNQ